MSQTSPIIAISYAIKMGAKEIILYGVDFLNHRKWSRGTKSGDREIKVYCKFFAECERIGVKVYLGSNGTAFDLMLPLYYGGEPYWPKYQITQDAIDSLEKRTQNFKPEEMK